MSKTPPTVTFEKVKQQYYPEWSHRPGTAMFPIKMNFVFINGGMGDYLAWIQPILWLATQATWIKGKLICPIYLKEVAQYFLKGTGWDVAHYKEMENIPAGDETPCRGPLVLQNESLNATGAHLSTCGWVYFTNKERAPAGWDSYPQFKAEDLEAIPLPESLQGKKYAVLTTGITTPSRHIPGNYWNPILEHLVSKGITPVFLGKSVVETGNAKNIHTEFDRSVRYELGIDLRDKTTIIEAASVMHRAECVIGHDNGLLHLAGCTPRVPIVFGYNLASPEHREPKRPHLAHNGVWNVTLTKSDLGCNHCQSTFNFVIGYNFRECFYSDLKCIEMLFEDGAKRWKWAIDAALEKHADDSSK